jgi:predicted DNA-binding WGR domain protein
MQLIQRATLAYQAGNSDKVYEVDLCQIATDRYVVNYRYGRRGGNLREGAETVAAVPLAEAQRVFDRLVRSKVTKGYQVAGTAAPELVTATVLVPVSSEDLAARNQAILARLTAAVQNQNPVATTKQWQLERVIWRAGELQLAAAAPLLIQLWGDNPLRNYSIAWALGNCGNDYAIAMLKTIQREVVTPPHIRQIALEAIAKLSVIAAQPLRALG